MLTPDMRAVVRSAHLFCLSIATPGTRDNREHSPRRQLNVVDQLPRIRAAVLGLLAIVAIGRVLSAQATRQPETAGTLWRSANRAVDSGDVAKYRRLMTRAVALAPQHPAVLFGLARADALSGREDEALMLLERLAAMGFARFDATDSAFASLVQRPDFVPIADRFALNRQPIVASTIAFTVPGPDRIPENVAFEPRTKSFFVGSLAERTIVRVKAGGTPEPFAGPDDGLLRVVGMKVDTAPERLWAASWAPITDSARRAAGVESQTRLFAFDLASGRRLLTLVPSDTTRSHLLNDLVLTAAGDVYVTDTGEGSIYRIRSGVDTLERFVRPDRARFNSPNGIALSGDGTALYVAFVEGIARVDLATRKVRYLTVPRTITTSSVDGLYWYDGDLIGVQMPSVVERVVRFVLDSSGTQVMREEVLERAHPAYRYPTTGVIVDDALYYIANPGWDRLQDDNTVLTAETPSPTVILRLPLRRAASVPR